MSLDFNAVFALGPGFRGAGSLRDELATEPAAIRGVVERYRARWRAQTWTLEEPDETRTTIVGPGGFALTVSLRAISLYHVVRFRDFTAEDEERQLLRCACLAIATIVGSPRVIYKHELLPDGFHEGLDLDGIEAVLRAKFGPPSVTFTALAAAEEYGPGCWYIDDLADLGDHASR